jgi:hypothetical protein
MIVLFGRILGGDDWLLNRHPRFLRKPFNNRKKSKNHSIGESDSKKNHKTTKIPAILSLAKNERKTFARFNCHSVNQEVRTAKNQPKKEK